MHAATGRAGKQYEGGNAPQSGWCWEACWCGSMLADQACGRVSSSPKTYLYALQQTFVHLKADQFRSSTTGLSAAVIWSSCVVAPNVRTMHGTPTAIMHKGGVEAHLCTVGSISSRLQTWSYRIAAASAAFCRCPHSEVHLKPSSHCLQAQDLPEHTSPSPQPRPLPTK